MPKRKRSSPPSDDDASTLTSLSRQKKLCANHLTTAHKAVVNALRLGAGFERQKHSRRRKTAKEKNDDKALARLDAEYAVLKGLDFNKLAEQHLRKTIARVKSIKEHAALPSDVHEIEKTEDNAEALNVKARLYKVQAVKKAVDGCIEALKEALGAGTATNKEAKKSDKQVKKAKIQQKADEEAGVEFSDGEDAFSAFDARIAAPSSGEDSDDSLSDGHRPPSIEDSASGEDDADPDSESGSASESSEAVGWEGFSEEDSDSDSDSDSEKEEASEPDDESLAPSKAQSKAKSSTSVLPSSSTFLPSLSHAGYYSGSESEASDLDEIFKPRKNRRGQKARQKIWEQKYGAKAKHVEKQEREKGWDPKRGAVGDDRKRGGRSSMTGRGPERSGENAMPLGEKKKTKRDDVGQLHPSWLAAKAAKEKKINVKPQGTKVVFD